MKDFRDELLEFLFVHSSENMDIKPLTDKYCGEDTTFDTYDETKPKCRLRINTVLRELKDMGWITLYPQGGMSTAHGYNQELNKRQFIMDETVRVRMTMTGEIEYKKLKQEPIPQVYNDNSIKVAGNLSGNANTGHIEGNLKQGTSDGKEDKTINKKNYRLNKWMIVLAIIAIAVTITIYLLQRGQTQ